MKEKYGQYMTPSIIADFMCSLIDHDNTCRILEPSSGKEVFLDTLEKYGFKNYIGYEIDSDLINNKNVINRSFISEDFSEKFDVIIGNPPYIRWKNLEENLKEELLNNSLFNKYLNALNDYSAMFILKSVELLNEGGELIFITPDYWLDTTHCQNLRDYLANNGYFTDLFLFKETPIFKGVNVSLQIFRYIKGENKINKNINIHLYNNKKRASDFEELIQDLKNSKSNKMINNYEIKQFLPNNKWLIVNDQELNDITVFENGCKKDLLDYSTLEDVCEIGNGMVSGLDKAFQIKDFDSLNEFEKQNTIKVIKAKSLNPYYYDDLTYYIFLENADIQSEEELIEKCPNFYNLLLPYKNDLLKRYSYNREIKYWMWVFLRNYKLFSENQNKIFVPCKERISNKDNHRFCLTNDYIFPTQDVSAIVPFPETKESIEYIAAHLNSSLVFNWIKHKGIVKGNIVEFSRAPLASIPFRKIDFNNEKEANTHDEITKIGKLYVKTKEKKLLEKINNFIKELY